MKKDFAILSRPHSLVVNGITVRKLSVGEYLDKSALISEAIEALLDSLFPGATATGVLKTLKNIDGETLGALMRRAICTAPAAIVRLMSSVLGADEKSLLALSPIEIAEVLSAFEKENRIADFIRAVRELSARGRTMTDTGFKG